jgi:lipoprotein-anchoring transpeptidase ErfK/SrfK
VTARPTTRRLAAATLALFLVLTSVACSGSDKATKAKATTTKAVASTVAPTTAGIDPNTPGAPAPESLVAHAEVADLPIFDAPDGAQVTSLANPIASGAPLVFLVVAQQPGWVQVMLPTRPNGSTGWVQAASVTTTSHHYRMDVVLSKHLITVMDGANVLLQTPIAVGTSDTPTPAQTFFTTELLKPVDESGTYIPEGDYGPFAYGLSGHSDVLQTFGGGDGQLGIHGTNEPASIGQSVSHGCVRVPNDVVTQLVDLVPLGTPVTIS